MPVKRDASGRKSVTVEVDVPGTPEEVWRAIATGPGIASWFVPTNVEERVGGAIKFQMYSSESSATITGWDPPRRLVYEERDWAPGAPPLATEIVVETRSGGRCVVRLVNSLMASGESWDNELESFESGWPTFFRVLRMYLTHFRGMRSSAFHLARKVDRTEVDAWTALTRALDLSGIDEGKRWSSPTGAPRLAGVAEWKGIGKNLHHMLLRLEAPMPGAACISAYTWDSPHVAVSVYHYGDGAADEVARSEPQWRAWIDQRFGSSGAASQCA